MPYHYPQGVTVNKMASVGVRPPKHTDAFYYEFKNLRIEAHELYSKDHYPYIHVDDFKDRSPLPQMRLLRSLSGNLEKIDAKELFALQFTYPELVKYYRKETITWLTKLRRLLIWD